MLEDLKGPLVLSATLHMLVALVAMIWSLIEPDKKPEELIFELYSPPAPAQQAAEQPSEDLYKPEELDLPTLEDIEVDLPEVSVVEDLPPEPEPEPEPEPVEPEVKKMTREEFIRKTGGIPKQRLSSKPKKRETVDMSNEVRELMESLDQLREARLPESTLSQMSSQQESELAHYFSSLKAAICQSARDEGPFSAASKWAPFESERGRIQRRPCL